MVVVSGIVSDALLHAVGLIYCQRVRVAVRGREKYLFIDCRGAVGLQGGDADLVPLFSGEDWALRGGRGFVGEVLKGEIAEGLGRYRGGPCAEKAFRYGDGIRFPGLIAEEDGIAG